MDKLVPVLRALPSATNGHVVESTPPPQVCPVCKGTGYVRYHVPDDDPQYGHAPWTHPKFGKPIPCQCKTVADVKRALSRTYSWLGAPEDQVRELDAMTFATFDPRANGESVALAYKRARGYAEMLKAQTEGQRNGLLVGPLGVGKTHLAAAIINAARLAGVGCLFASGNEFFQALYDSFDEDRKERILKQAAEIPLLCFDDLDKMQVREDGSYQKTTLFTLFNARYVAKKPTIITANADDDWRQWLHPAVLSRMFGKTRVEAIGMQGRDYRMIGG